MALIKVGNSLDDLSGKMLQTEDFKKQLEALKNSDISIDEIPEAEPVIIKKINSKLEDISKLPIWQKINKVPTENTLIVAKTGTGKTFYLEWLKSQIVIDRLGQYSEVEETDFMEIAADRYRYDIREESANLFKSENKFILLDQWFACWTKEMPKFGKEFDPYYNFMSKVYKAGMKKNQVIVLCTNKDFTQLGFPEDMIRWIKDCFHQKIFVS